MVAGAALVAVLMAGQPALAPDLRQAEVRYYVRRKKHRRPPEVRDPGPTVVRTERVQRWKLWLDRIGDY